MMAVPFTAASARLPVGVRESCWLEEGLPLETVVLPGICVGGAVVWPLPGSRDCATGCTNGR